MILSRRRMSLVAVWMMTLVLCGSRAAGQDAAAGLRVAPDHDNGVYASGEKVQFVVTGAEDEASYEVQLNGAKMIDSGKVQFKKGKAAIACGLKEPGWLMVTVTAAGGATAKAGAAVDPFKIKPSLPAPNDFDKFWDAQKKKLAAVPMNARLTPVEEERKVNYGPEVVCFDVQLDCLGDKPASGYYCRPKDAKRKSLPAFLSLHSAGIRGSSQQAAWMRAKQNMLGLDLNAHGLPNGKPAEFYNGLTNGELRGYASKGIDSPETFYFLGMYLQIVRAIDFLTSQPEWDGKTVIVGGSSQGGGQSLVAAGIDPRVTELQASVPAFCDQTGFVLDRKPGWPGTR
ncbi:MAG: acetylxylan esterase, partial [Planctomycetes bacterium]|nr:acetylxylan esterase [Planctomycetota bacterium]